VQTPPQPAAKITAKISPRMMARLMAMMLPHRKAYGIVCGLGIVIGCLEMIPPRLVGQAIDLMSVHGFAMRPLLSIVGIWLAIAVANQAMFGWQIYLANTNGEKILSDLRARIFDHLQVLSMRFYDQTHPGCILTMTGSDIEAIRNVLIWGLNTVIANSAIMLLASVMIYQTDHEIFFATAWLAPAMTIVNFFYGKKVSEAWQIVRRHYSLVGANQAENIAGVRVVVAFNRQEQNLKTFNELQNINTANNVMASRKAGLFNPLLQWVKFIGVSIILLLGGYRVATTQLLPGSLVAILLYWDWFMTPAVNFGTFFNELLVALAGAERIFELLDRRPEITDAAQAGELPKITGAVSFKNVCFRYQDSGRLILDQVSFETLPGQMIALVGETGSGKSTILSLIARFYNVSAGTIEIDGHDIAQVTSRSLHSQMAMVLQTNFLFSGTVLENLRYARPQATDEEIFAAAEKMGCHERFLALPSGYVTQVGEKGNSLSLGERQLVCFTRALIADPRILLLDEATSALDPVTGLQVQRALGRLIRGRTTFIVTHRLSTVRFADLILVTDQGRIVESGKHQDLLERRGKYFELFMSSQPKSARSFEKHA
jgi:ABC-type multidrug transport system fused ATPase/permease subunit